MNLNYFPFKKRDFKILNETKILHQKNKDLSKIQILEFSILLIMLNFFEVALKRIEELASLNFLSEKNESLKNTIIASISNKLDENTMQSKISSEYSSLIKEINENSNIQLILKNKNDDNILELLDELTHDFKVQNNLKKIESLEKKLLNNLDENSYSELLKLKSQLNRE